MISSVLMQQQIGFTSCQDPSIPRAHTDTTAHPPPARGMIIFVFHPLCPQSRPPPPFRYNGEEGKWPGLMRLHPRTKLSKAIISILFAARPVAYPTSFLILRRAAGRTAGGWQDRGVFELQEIRWRKVFVCQLELLFASLKTSISTSWKSQKKFGGSLNLC